MSRPILSGQHALAEDRGSLQDGRSPFLQLVLVDREPNMDVFYGEGLLAVLGDGPGSCEMDRGSCEVDRWSCETVR
ncbi:unnamed protein product [Arctogadus glacialis]